MDRRTFVRVGVVAAGAVAAGGGLVTSATWAPAPELARERMGSGMRKVLVTYATKSGSVSGIAERIGETFGGSGLQVDVRPVSDEPDPGGYDAVVVGSGVRMGSWHQPAKDWVKAHAETLESKPVAFFTVGLIITDPSKTADVRAYTDALIAEAGVDPVDVGLFAGWGLRKRFSFLERTIMNAMKAPDADERDMGAIAAWAKATAAKMELGG